MDPALDPPPVSAQPAGVLPAAAAIPNPVQPVPQSHPPYAEMIVAAVTALNESGGSSKRAISKYIEQNYGGLPPTHQGLLTQHIKHLKASGQLVMVKYSYKLSDGSAPPAVNGAVSATAASTSATKRRGRPPKPKPDAVQPALPVFGAPAGPETSVNGAGSSVRGRGRPPKNRGGASSGRGRGRPKKNPAPAPVPAPAPAVGKRPGRPRGRPRKAVNVVGGVAPVTLPATVPASAPSTSGKRRGRPPRAGGGVAKKPMKRSGRSVGRPRKNPLVNPTPESQLLVSYLGLKEKLDTLKEKVSETAALIRPSLIGEAALNALHELEMMAASMSALPDAHQPPPAVQPQI